MCKVTLAEEGSEFKSFYASNETVLEILGHFKINPDTKNIYLNGQELTKERLKKKIPDSGAIHLVIENKTVLRSL